MYNNPYYNPTPRYQPMPMPNQPMAPQSYVPSITQSIQPIGLLGKVVDSIDVVKSMDIPLDGSVSYFALADGSAIVTKQLQNDGTSKKVVYKPILEDKKDNQKYVTFEELKKEIAKIDLSELENFKDELSDIKKQLKAKKSKED